MSLWVGMGALLVALAIDLALGEPPARWHPVVWMGRYLGWVGKRCAPLAATPGNADDWRAFWRGTLAWWLGAVIVVLAAWALVALSADWHPLAAAVVLGLALKPLLAWRMLRDEVLAVEEALAVSLDAGRAQLSRLVSRDVAQLSEAEVRESAIESLAENLNDSVVAPIFWFALFGLPGAALYRFANTADAMWGYHGLRRDAAAPGQSRDWEWAGKWAARADDVLSWVPARLTALLLALVAREVPVAFVRREAARTPSPNSGWPMAAMALALGVQLRKPGVYALHAQGRAPGAGDAQRAVMFASKAVLCFAALSALLLAWAAMAWA
jgi:adenosylcobinamide-phosphate synthase